MYTLAFDTTANGVSVLLSKDGRTIDLFQEEMDFGQAEVLIPEIRNTLEAENLQFKDLGLAVVWTRLFYRRPFFHFRRPGFRIGLSENQNHRRFGFRSLRAQS